MLNETHLPMLTANPAYGAMPATPGEQLLADAIRMRVSWYYYAPSATRDVTPHYVEELRKIADGGLAAKSGTRDFAAARNRFLMLYGPLDAAKPAPPGDTTGAFITWLDDEEKLHIKLNRLGPKPTDLQRAFALRLINADRLIRQLYERGWSGTEGKRKLIESLQKLEKAAELGLEGVSYDLTLGGMALDDTLADAMQDNGAKVRTSYLKRLAWTYFKAAVVSVGVLGAYYFGTSYFLGGTLKGLQITQERLAFTVVATLSLLCGAWLSAAQRLQPSSEEVLASLFSETFSNWVRAAFVIGFGWFALLLLHEQVVVLTFGSVAAPSDASGFKTHLALRDLAAAILTGGFLGLAERAVPAGVLQRANTLAAALAPK